jgi:hypothetical protein
VKSKRQVNDRLRKVSQSRVIQVDRLLDIIQSGKVEERKDEIESIKAGIAQCVVEENIFLWFLLAENYPPEP